VLLTPCGVSRAEDVAEAVRQPGVLATYEVPGRRVPVRRSEAVLGYALDGGASPDPRIPNQGWKVTWEGVIEILQPGTYRFAARASGPVSLAIDGKQALDVAALSDEVIVGPEVMLAFGLHRLTGSFAPQGEGAQLELMWESSGFAREPLGPQAVGHVGEWEVDDAFARGELAVEKHRCAACHGAESDSGKVHARPLRGPSLSAAGTRLNAEWMYRWLGAPDDVHPEASMPRLFAEDRNGQIERSVLAQYLAKLGMPPAEEAVSTEEHGKRCAEGGALYRRIGCQACHEAQEERPALWSLSGLWMKTNEAALAEYLRDPMKVHPDGAMPGMGLSVEESQKLACYLLQVPMAGEAVEPLPRVSREELLALGGTLGASGSGTQPLAALADDALLDATARGLLQSRRCTACHDLPGEISTAATAPDLAAICAKAEGGCLSKGMARGGNVPRYSQRLPVEDVRTFLLERGRGSVHNAPGYTAELAMERLNCRGCHRRNEQGGLSTAMQAELSGGQAELTAELIVPPTLTGISHKLTPGALAGVLKEGKRCRPWMSLRMPQFGARWVESLNEGLHAADAHGDEVLARDEEVRDELVEAGRELIGAKGFGCTKCHDMLGVASGGTRGPDLALVTSRVERDWFERWLRDPQRIEPGTRMPTVFLEGQSPHAEILGGDPARQREAMWQYLSVSDLRPPPEGLELPVVQRYPRGERLIVARAFLPGLSPRGIAMRFGNGVHLAFDAQTCRLGYAWTGDFLDMAPTWTDRGGGTAGVLGPVIWNAPPVFPWAITSAEAAEPPSIRGRAQETEFGAPPSREPIPQPRQLRFGGYAIRNEVPTFRYVWERPEGSKVEFSERLESLRCGAGEGVERDARVEGAEGTVWWWVGSSETSPTWRQEAGTVDAGTHQAATAGIWCQVQNEGRPLWVGARDASAGAEWVTVEREGGFEVWLRLPGAGERMATVSLWRPRDDRPESITQIEAHEQLRAAKSRTEKQVQP